MSCTDETCRALVTVLRRTHLSVAHRDHAFTVDLGEVFVHDIHHQLVKLTRFVRGRLNVRPLKIRRGRLTGALSRASRELSRFCRL